jgi:hypothetical protein
LLIFNGRLFSNDSLDFEKIFKKEFKLKTRKIPVKKLKNIYGDKNKTLTICSTSTNTKFKVDNGHNSLRDNGTRQHISKQE